MSENDLQPAGELNPMYEVELKFAVSGRAALERRLVELGGRLAEPQEQVDRYFAHPCRDFAQTDEALRLRRVGDSVAITWKGPRIDAATKTRREIELELAPLPAALDAGPTLSSWTELLEALGFRRVMEVAKRRQPLRLVWQGAEVDVALDTVAGLGEFLELEIMAAEGEVPAARARLESLAQEIGLGPTERRSYLELILQSQPAGQPR
jgi:adenylate cyclase class 2